MRGWPFTDASVVFQAGTRTTSAVSDQCGHSRPLQSNNSTGAVRLLGGSSAGARPAARAADMNARVGRPRRFRRNQLIVEAVVIALPMVMRHELGERPAQVSLTEEHEPIEPDTVNHEPSLPGGPSVHPTWSLG
jgi:hypothetical protein